MNDRRGFIKGAFGLAAGVPLAGAAAQTPVPGTAEEKLKVLAGRGRWERLTLAYHHVKAGATKPFSILHISDTHFTDAYDHEAKGTRDASKWRRCTFGGMQEQAFADSLEWAKKNVDWVVHTGDLMDWQSEANHDLIRKYFTGNNIFGAVGNHEFYTYLPGEKKEPTEAFKERSWPILKSVYPDDVRFNSRVINGVNFICIDDVFGTVQQDQVDRFREEAKKGLPMILCMHVPFFDDELYMMNRKYWTSGSKFTSAEVKNVHGDYKRQKEDPVTRDFIAWLKKFDLLKGILCGHLHIVARTRFSPSADQYVVGGNYLFGGAEMIFT